MQQKTFNATTPTLHKIQTKKLRHKGTHNTLRGVLKRWILNCNSVVHVHIFIGIPRVVTFKSLHCSLTTSDRSILDAGVQILAFQIFQLIVIPRRWHFTT